LKLKPVSTQRATAPLAMVLLTNVDPNVQPVMKMSVPPDPRTSPFLKSSFFTLHRTGPLVPLVFLPVRRP
jgi:hypothetical protein